MKLSQVTDDWYLPTPDGHEVHAALEQLVSLGVCDACLQTVRLAVAQQVEPFVIAALVKPLFVIYLR